MTLLKLKKAMTKTYKRFEDEYNFDDIKNKFDDGKFPEILEFFMGEATTKNLELTTKCYV